MVHLTVRGLSDDGTRLVLVSDAGVEFTVDADDRLHQALAGPPGSAQQVREQARGDQARHGQREQQMDVNLRPRDIQARIRAGESPESVAQVAGTTVEKVMPFAAPVLAERAHVAQRAQRASVRRRPGDGAATGSRTLGDAIGGHLRSRNVDPETVSWDAWRREDSRWTLTGTFSVGARVGAAHFSFDQPGNYVVADDEDAHWLLGEVPDPPAAATAPDRSDDLSSRRRRLSAVPPDELPLGEDAIEMVSEPEPAAATPPEQTASLGAEIPVEAYLDDEAPEAATDEEEADSETDETSTATDSDSDSHDDSDDAQPHREPPTRKPVKKTRGRASVPSWDEIMFGGGESEDR